MFSDRTNYFDLEGFCRGDNGNNSWVQLFIIVECLIHITERNLKSGFLISFLSVILQSLLGKDEVSLSPFLHCKSPIFLLEIAFER